ncbi:MAG: Na+/H+ antiporter subunit E [Verrucomicrobiales bacterium]
MSKQSFNSVARRILLKTWYVISFLGIYAVEVVKSNIRVARDALWPKFSMSPAFVAIPLDAKTDMECLILANLITMTPGSLSVDISQDRKYLYVHGLYVTDCDALRAEIKNNLERRVLRIFR